MKTPNLVQSLILLVVFNFCFVQQCIGFSNGLSTGRQGRQQCYEQTTTEPSLLVLNMISEKNDGQMTIQEPFIRNLASLMLGALIFVSSPLPAYSVVDDDVQGISAVTQSRLGESVRGAVIGGAQIADTLDL